MNALIRHSLLRNLLRPCRTAAVLILIPLGVSAGISTAQGATLFTAALDGLSESPPNASPGTGVAMVTHDPAAHTLSINVSFSGLIGNTTVAHIHAPTAVAGQGNVGVAVTPGTLPDFPAGVTSGSYVSVLDLTQSSTYTAGFLTLGGGTAAGAEALLASAMDDGTAYFNIHSTEFPAGEIRGFLTRARVPESGTGAALMAGVIGSLACVRGRQRKA